MMSFGFLSLAAAAVRLVRRPSEDLLSKPSVEGLAYLLRHQELWPENFTVWNYSHPDTCAIGLASAYWKIACSSSRVASALGMTSNAASKIFLMGGSAICFPITPEDIARDLESYSLRRLCGLS